jgi:Transposase DDE domain
MVKSSKVGTLCQEEQRGEELDELGKEGGEKCFTFLRPFLKKLDRHVDVRLVRTLANLVPVVLKRHDRSQALLLSQLGDDLEREGHGPAGTKRIDNLLKTTDWQAEEIAAELIDRAKELVTQEAALVPEKRALCILDGSVEEKPESSQLDGLAPINSAKARRLRRPRPHLGKGYYRGPLGPPTIVPGFSWLGILVTGWAERTRKRPVTLAASSFYRRVAKTDPRHENWDEEIPTADAGTAGRKLIAGVVEAVGADSLLFVGDREYGTTPWVTFLVELHLPFIVRWKKGNHLRPEDAPSVDDPLASPSQRHDEGRAAWKLTQNLLFRQKRTIFNPRNPKQPLPVTFGAIPVRLVDHDDQLWLVYVQVGKGGRRHKDGEPWRLVTNFPLQTQEEVWRVVEAYAARWQIEQAIRLNKTELRVETVRVRFWQRRAKLLAIASLAFAFLVWLLGDTTSPLVHQVLQIIHRTGRQANEAWRPIYRLLQALAKLWKAHTPTFQGVP